MFTGIIEELGRVESIQLLPQSAVLTLNAQKVLEGTVIGDSIAVNGVCLTVTGMNQQTFSVDVMAETLSKTSLAELKRGSPANLERALQLKTRLGGHLVSGHVDGTGTIRRITRLDIAHIYEIQADSALLPYILPKGSIALDGISLTVVDVHSHSFSVSLIPHTFQETTLGYKGTGAIVNLETDLIGKYVARFLGREIQKEDKLSFDFLQEHGFL
ncbi:MAG: riboflavin synthase [Desulfitobacteriaceae bacterium]|nr:riboflavin synthase [Desulfitobacteriaceae bacterium]MDI6878555.1 riboflavin synthase [Desulfitobacteriaceae bacterium]MDI6913974.1 riboflavin synthase [Desulfitobacteriaceae bacterium]